jgi:hypothetical protein
VKIIFNIACQLLEMHCIGIIPNNSSQPPRVVGVIILLKLHMLKRKPKWTEVRTIVKNHMAGRVAFTAHLQLLLSSLIGKPAIHGCVDNIRCQGFNIQTQLEGPMLKQKNNQLLSLSLVS